MKINYSLLIMLFVILHSFLYFNNDSYAAYVEVTNYSFENPAYSDGGWGNSVQGWETFGFKGVFNPTYSQLTQGATNGQQVGYTNTVGLAMSQTLQATTITKNTNYTLYVDILSRTDGYTNQKSTIELRTTDGILLATASLANLSGGSIYTLIATYTANNNDQNLGKGLKILLYGGGTQSLFDNVRLDANSVSSPSPVPIPSSAIILGLGMVMLASIGRKFR